VGNSNIKPFIIGIVICSLGAFLSVEMLDSTSWTTQSTTRNEDYHDGDMWMTLDYTNEMEIGLHEVTFVQKGEICDEDGGYCTDLNEDWRRPILEITGLENEPLDCPSAQDKNELEICEVESAGSTGYLIILVGLGLLAFTFVLACIGVMGYIPGRVLSWLSSLSAIVILAGPIVWFVMSPDLNIGMEPEDGKWGLSHAFFLSLLSAPVIFVGGFVWGSTEAFALDKDDDWDDDEHSFYQTEDAYTTVTTSMTRPDPPRDKQPDRVDVNSQGEWGDDGYEWIEHPEGSEIWYWRDQDTGQWMLYS